MKEFIKVDGKKICDIRIFALSTCVWCKKAKTLQLSLPPCASCDDSTRGNCQEDRRY